MSDTSEAINGERQFAIIAGSGFQELSDESDGRVFATAFGAPSSPIRDLQYGDRTVFLLSRHGDSLLIPPHRINYRANMKALEMLGVTDIIALNTVGVIAKGLPPGSLAVPDQIIDYTSGRDHSIYDEDSASLDHIDFSNPLDLQLRQSLLWAAKAIDVSCNDGGVYAVTQGPRLETAAEVNRLEIDGADYVGMTAMPEASLSMELGMRFACLSLIVNYAAGRGEKAIHEDIEASTASAREQSMKILREFFQTGTHDPGVS
jgi:5'-methylthioinosine phosphorylase